MFNMNKILVTTIYCFINNIAQIGVWAHMNFATSHIGGPEVYCQKLGKIDGILNLLPQRNQRGLHFVLGFWNQLHHNKSDSNYSI